MNWRSRNLFDVSNCPANTGNLTKAPERVIFETNNVNVSDCVSPGGILKGEAGESNHIMTTCDNHFRYMIYVPFIIIYQFGFRAGQDKCTEIPAEGQLTWANSPIRFGRDRNLFASEASVEHHSWPSFAQWIWCCLDKSDVYSCEIPKTH